MWLFDKILVNESFVFRGDLETLHRKLKGKYSYFINKKSEHVISNNSFMGISSQSSPVLFMKVKAVSSEKFNIRIYSKFRKGYYIILILFSFMFLMSSSDKNEKFYIPFIVIGIGTLFLTGIMFFQKYRDYSLLDNIIGTLKIKRSRIKHNF